jgi:hypothetical protein
MKDMMKKMGIEDEFSGLSVEGDDDYAKILKEMGLHNKKA